MKKKKNILSVLSPYAYITPISLILLTFVAGSLIIAVCFSFTKYNIITPAKFNGLFNYEKLFRDTKLRLCIMNTIKITVIAVPLQILTSTMLAASIAARNNTFLGKFAKAALFIPVLSSSAVIGTIWKAILNGGHPAVKFLFGLVGIDPTMLLGDSTTAIVTLSMLIVWKSMGYYMIITLSSLMSIPDNYYEVLGWTVRILESFLPDYDPSFEAHADPEHLPGHHKLHAGVRHRIYHDRRRPVHVYDHHGDVRLSAYL